MADSLSLERRRAARVPIVIPVEVADERGFSLHSTSDLSLGGCFFARAIPHPVGATVTLTLRPPGHEPIRCRGQIANVPDTANFGMGIRFVDLKEADRAVLSALIDSQENP